MSEGELDGLLGEIGGACTYDNMVKMFQEKMAGDGNDSDDLIVQAFKAYDQEGKIDSKRFTHALMTWGDKMTKAEIDDVFGEFEIDEDYMIKSKDVIGLFVAVKEEKKTRERPRKRKRRRRRPPSKCHFFFLFFSYPAMFDSLETSRREQKHKKDKNTILNIPQITVLYCIIVSTVQYTIAIV